MNPPPRAIDRVAEHQRGDGQDDGHGKPGDGQPAHAFGPEY